MWGFFWNQWMQVCVCLRCILWLGNGCGWAHMIPEHLLHVLIVCIFDWKTHEGFCSCQWPCCCSLYFRWGLCSLWAQMWCSIQRGGSAENTMRHQSLGCTVEIDFMLVPCFHLCHSHVRISSGGEKKMNWSQILASCGFDPCCEHVNDTSWRLERKLVRMGYPCIYFFLVPPAPCFGNVKYLCYEGPFCIAVSVN